MPTETAHRAAGAPSLQEAPMPTITVTRDHRFAAIAAERKHLGMGDEPLAAAIGSARFADSFPDSYTTEAVEASLRLIVATAENPTEVPALATEVLRLQFDGRWYA